MNISLCFSRIVLACFSLIGSIQISYAQANNGYTFGDTISYETQLELIEITLSGIDSVEFGSIFEPIVDLNLVEVKRVVKNRSKEMLNLTYYSFWFKSCSPCLAEKPMLNRLAIKYQQEVDFVAISFEDSTTISDYTASFDSNFSHYSADDIQLSLYLKKGYPTSVITMNGKIVFISSGGPPVYSKYKDEVLNYKQSLIEQILDTLLKDE